MTNEMTQPKLFNPQFESSRHETWCFGIIFELHGLVNENSLNGQNGQNGQNGLNSLNGQIGLISQNGTTIDNGLTLDQKPTEHKDKLDLPNLRKLKLDLYETLLSKVGNSVRRVCSEISDPTEKISFQSRFLENIFLNVLKENGLLTEPTKHYYESVLDIFPRTTFGLGFFIDLMSDQGWYKYGSKFLDHFSDPNQVEIILTKLNELSCDIHLTVLKVAWLIEISLAKYDDDNELLKFIIEAKKLKEQSSAKTFNLKENLAIYLALLNVYLEAFLVNATQMASRERGLDKPMDPNDCDWNNPQPEIIIGFQPISAISHFIRDLEKILFPDYEYNNTELLHDYFDDPKSAAILEMITSISGIYEFLEVIASEIKVLPLEQIQFGVFRDIQYAWESWENKAAEVSIWSVLSLERFFSPDRDESRFLTIAVLNTRLPKYFDILEAIPSETYLDPRVMHTLGLSIMNAERTKHIDDLILILKKVLKSVKSKKRMTSFFKARVALHGLQNYGEPHKSKLNLLLNNQQSGSIVYNQVRDDILLSAYLYPCDLIDRIIADALEHRHTTLPFLCNLFCTELSPVCSSIVDDRFGNTCFECLLNGRLTTPPSDASVQGLMMVIKDVHTYYCNAKTPILPKILTLEKLMLCLAWDGCCDPLKSVEAKFSIFKLIQSLSDACDTPWNFVKRDPQYIIYNLVQFIDYFFNDGSRKIEILNFIEYIMSKKVCRKLLDDEYIWMRNRSEHHEEETTLLAHLQPWLESPLHRFIDVSKLKPWHVYMIAGFAKDNVWLRYSNRNPVRNDYYLKEQIATIMRVFSRPEYDNLFYFLCHYLPIDETVAALVGSYTAQKEFVPTNTEYETNCLCDCIEFHCENFYKEPREYFCKRRKEAMLPKSQLLPVVYRHVDKMYDFFLNTTADAERIGKTLTKLAEEMKKLDVDADKWFFQNDWPLNMQSKSILREFYGPLYYKPKPYKEPPLRPG